MPTLKLQVKPTAGGDKFFVEIESDITIVELKEEVAKHCQLAAAEQRLIYKGQILKDERTVDSYGIVTDHVLHLVRGRPANPPPAPSPAAAAAAPSPMGMGGAFPAGMGGGFPGNPQQFEEMASQMMGSPMIQQLLNNPELMRTMMQSNPAVRQIIDQHPEMAQIFNNPQILRESLQIAANPSLMREHMRNTDRAMSNMELHPEGFNMLRRVYEDIQQPLMNAANSPSDASAQNPLAALFPNLPAATTAPASAPAATPASAPLNTDPLPNPWAAAPGAGGNAAAGGLGALGALGGLPGMGGGFPAGMGNPAEMLQDPMMQSMMSSLMSNPQFMESMINSNPMLRNMADANPQVREVLGNPEMLQQMMAPENLAAMGQMQQLMQNNPMLRNMMMGPAAGGGAAGGLGGAAGQPAATGMPDMAALMNMMGGMGGGMGAGMGGGFGAPAVPAPVADPGTHYATQIQQLQDMGFYDRDSNIRALQQTGGNVNAAVDRLLGGV